MNLALLMILLIVTAILAQAVAFFVTFRIRRKSGEKENEQ